MRWPLRYQILLPFAGAMLAVVVGVSLLDAFLAARRTERRIEDQLRHVAGTLSEATSGNLYQAFLSEVEPPLFHAVLHSAFQNHSAAADLLGIHRATLRKKLQGKTEEQ